MSAPVIYDASGHPIQANRLNSRRLSAQQRALLAGFKGANDQNLAEWVYLPTEINDILRTDLRKLRARSRDLARNDDSARRFLFLLKQNVLGHAGIKLQAKNKLRDGKKPDLRWNQAIETEWHQFSRKRRRRGQFEAPSACGQLTQREIAWLTLWCRAIDGECFIQILHGYPHNRHRFAVRFLNPDLLDSGYNVEHKGNRVEMGIEFDEFDRPVAYHFNKTKPNQTRTRSVVSRERIPVSQIIHIYRHEYVGQIRGIPDFAAIMHKAKMLNGVHEAIVVGWRVAASKMGFFTSSNPEEFNDSWDEDDQDNGAAPADRFGINAMDATPGTLDVIPNGLDLKLFDPEYPTSTYESGNKVFMQQIANGLNVSSPTLANNYEGVTYSSLRQALLEDREGWRCIQAEMIDGFYQPLFDEWYEWTTHITGHIVLSQAKLGKDPVIEWQPRGWPWIDPLKEVKAQVEAVNNHLRTMQSVMTETTGADFTESVDTMEEEQQALEKRNLRAPAEVEQAAKNQATTDPQDTEDDE